jgi:hypothetical protein
MYLRTKIDILSQLLAGIKQLYHFILLILFISANAFAQAPADSSIKTMPDSSTILLKEGKNLKKSASKDSVAVKKPKGDIETKVEYHCEDSLVFDVINKKVFMYNKTEIHYGDIALKADYSDFDMSKNVSYASGVPDSTGKLQGKPVFIQGTDQYEATSMKYNFKTRRAIIKGVVTQQGEGYLHGENVKKQPDNNLFISSARYTTCNLEHPHFYIESKKIKAIPNKKLISGPFNLNIGGLPTPIGFPFGLFPTPKNQSSGIVVPTYGEAVDRGFFLRNGGYYWAANDYVGIKFLGDIYSKGSYGFSLLSNYKSRYDFDGSLDLRYNKRREGEGELALIGEDFWVNWSHRPVTKGTSSFSASVNAGSNSFNTRNSFDPNNYLSTTFSSNITYAKTFKGTPFNLIINARQNQNVQTKEMNIDLPDVAFGMNKIFPFKRANSSGNTWYERIGITYTLNAKNQISNLPVPRVTGVPGGKIIKERSPLADSTIRVSPKNFDLLIDRMKNGVSHNIPISTSFNVLKHIQVSPNLNYRENWYLRRLNFNYVPDSNAVDVDTIRRFSRTFDYNYGVAMQTRIYGIFYVKKLGIEAIRHVMNPSISFSYTPDFTDPKFGMMQRVQVNKDAAGNPIFANLNPYQGTLFGGPRAGRSGNVGFSLANNFEMKVRNKEDTSGKDPFKKVTLLDNLNFATGYNLLADSFHLAPVSFNARTRLLNKLEVNFGGILDPYTIKQQGTDRFGNPIYRRINEISITNGNGLGTLSSLNMNLSTNLNPAARKKKEAPKRQLSAMQEREIEFINANPELYVAWDIPWSLNISYNLNYSRQLLNTPTVVQSVNFFGDVNLTTKWKLGASSGYDFISKQLTFTNINIYRDLHCWEMRFNWIPFGIRQSYSVDINVKASVLQDLKLSRRRSWFDR